MKVILNGQLVDRNEAKVDIEDRGYQFGDGIYEGFRVYHRKIFTLDEHLQRLFRSAELIDMTIPYTQEELATQLYDLIEANQLDSGMLYLQISRGTQPPRNHVYLSETKAVMMATTLVGPRDPATFEKGITAVTAVDDRWLHCDIKSLNLLGNIMAKNQAAKVGADEAILYRDEDHVTECSHSNVSIVKDGVLITHPADNLILNGITRQTILKLARENDIPVEERVFTVEELKNADEVIVSSIMAEVTPVTAIDGKTIGDGKRGPISAKLEEYFTAEIEKNCGITL
ncbi:D-amino-acid transaminase [Enterococcus sp. 669A]|uniref:D-alanine aminotransferase n=1 Tax=Candidatus Enterococcus moelleringii TaxID=2815325 RepID=A0ABS3L6I6_9ENTE|nr:D-amino-acid transaminase [Enterococcus sp. 669A]MBO1305232.1 D-amino-acid transaminase [Enterococcus sp. 669A]